MQAKNQTYLRQKNKEDVINLLRKQSMSYSDIARTLQLSNTAISKIANDLISCNLVYRNNETRGRTGITLSINNEFGYVVAIDLSGRILNICVADFGGNVILEQFGSEIVHFTKEKFDELVKILHDIKNSEKLKNSRLCCICIATPGKINGDGEFIANPRFRGFKNISIKKILENEFNCYVLIKNDVKLALSGEKEYGTALTNVKNALMLHIDVGMGASFMFNGKVFEGCNGFAGEIGYFKLNMHATSKANYENLNYSNYYDILSLFSALTVVRGEVYHGEEGYLKNYCEENHVNPLEIPLQAMVDAYLNGDPLTHKVLNSSADVIGTVAENIAELLDIDTILLNGAVTELGDAFLNYISKHLEGRNVVYSTLRDKSTIMGAINECLKKAFVKNF